MTTSGQPILASDYTAVIGPNGSQKPYASDAAATNALAALWGIGYGTRGYGQTSITLNVPVAGQSVVAGSDWQNAINVINTMASYTTGGTVPTGVPNVNNYASGQKITASSYDWLNSALIPLDTNRFNALTSFFSEGNIISNSSSTSWGLGSTSHKGSISFECNVDLVAEDIARFYFNTGSKIRIRPSAIAPVPTPSQSQTWGSNGVNLWTVPAGVTSITVTRMLGAGGGGGSGNEINRGGGGGGGGSGGGWSNVTIPCAVGNVFKVVIGAGGGGGSVSGQGGIANGASGGDTVISLSTDGGVTFTELYRGGGGGGGSWGGNGTGGAGGGGGNFSTTVALPTGTALSGSAGQPGYAGQGDGDSGPGGNGANSYFGSWSGQYDGTGTGGAPGVSGDSYGGNAQGNAAGGGGAGFTDRTGPLSWSGGSGVDGYLQITWNNAEVPGITLANILNSISTIDIGYNTVSVNYNTTPDPLGVIGIWGYYTLTDSYNTLFNITDSTGRLSFTVQGKRKNYAGVNGGNGTGIQLLITLQDTNGSDTVDGTFGCDIKWYAPTTGLQVAKPRAYLIQNFDGSTVPTLQIFRTVISQDFTNYDLLADIKNQSPGYTANSPADVTVIVQDTAVVSSKDAVAASFLVRQLYPGSVVTIANLGVIAGHGGAGGAGASSGNAQCSIDGQPGGPGGPAIELHTNTILYNYGIIGGGGGGGGGGGLVKAAYAESNGVRTNIALVMNSGGGGGGAGGPKDNHGTYIGGAGGIPNPCGVQQNYNSSPGATGGLLLGGAGGAAYPWPGGALTTHGGAGGNLGQPGQAGQNGLDQGGAGGSAGYSIFGAANLQTNVSMLGVLLGPQG
jgi:hypothetical protein